MTSDALNVLLVEDDEIDVMVVRRGLGNSARVHAVGTIESALSALESSEWAYDCVLLDHRLPDGTSLDFFARYKAQVPVVVLSTQDDRRTATECIDAGADDFVVKGERSSSALLRAMHQSAERCRLRQRLREAALTDALTSVLNRRGLTERLEVEWQRAERDGKRLAALFIDCDGFKAVNDEFGHAVGDRALISVACRTTQALRPTDLVSRVGGDEFLVLLAAQHESEVERVAERIAGDIRSTPIETDKGPIQITVSVGWAWVHEPRLDAILPDVDRALRYAKGAGKDQVTSHSRLDLPADPKGLQAVGEADVERWVVRSPVGAQIAVMPRIRRDVQLRTPDLLARIGVDEVSIGDASASMVRACLRAHPFAAEARGGDSGLPEVILHLDPPSIPLLSQWWPALDIGAERERLGFAVDAARLPDAPKGYVDSLAALRAEGVRIGLHDFRLSVRALECFSVLRPDWIGVKAESLILSPGGTRILSRIEAIAETHGLPLLVEGSREVLCDRGATWFVVSPEP